MTQGLCSVEGCEAVRAKREWCNRHYLRWRRTGDPRNGKSTHPRMISERFWAKVLQDDDTGCWIWQASRFPQTGYGAFNVQGRVVAAHRFAYEDMVAEIPPGLVLDHLCRVRACVNPYHLEPVTDAVNIARGKAPSHLAKRSGTCQRGHPARYVNGHARCLDCTRLTNKEKADG